MTKLNHGQTIGKMLLAFEWFLCRGRTQLANRVDSRAMRTLRITIQSFLYLGYLPIVFNKNKQQAADYFAETSVVTINLIKAFNKQVDANHVMSGTQN